MKHAFARFGIALALCSVISAPAHAQFGKLGDAVKKKAKEVGNQAIGKEEPKKDETTSSSRPSSQMLITAEILDNFTKGLNAESTKRSLYVKRQECEKSAMQSTDFMTFMAGQGEEMGKQMKDDMTDAQKTAVMMKASEEMQKKQIVWLAKRCGPVVERMEASALDSVGADAGGFTAAQYGMLKERVTAYCDAVAHGSDTPSNHNLAFTDAEMAALKPRCAAYNAQLKRLN